MNKITSKKKETASQQVKCGLLIVVLAMLQLTACVKDDLYNTPHPNKGVVKVTTDWSRVSSDAILPTTHLLRIGDKEQTVSDATNVFPSLFDAGTHKLVVYHLVEGFSVNEGIATVNTLADGTLLPQPGYLFSGTRALRIVKDDTLRVTVPMQQHTRSLTLTLKLKSGDELRIARTSATLTGIISEIDLTTGAGKVSQGKTVAPRFELTTIEDRMRAAAQPALAAHLRLLGVTTTERQILTLIITLHDGYQQTITTDLTQALKNFGDDIKPLELDATLELVVPGEIGGSITDWIEVDNGNFPIH